MIDSRVVSCGGRSALTSSPENGKGRLVVKSCGSGDQVTYPSGDVQRTPKTPEGAGEKGTPLMRNGIAVEAGPGPEFPAT